MSLHQISNKDKQYHCDNLVALRQALDEFIENPTKTGLALQIQKPQDRIMSLYESGWIKSEEELESRMEAIPDYIKYEVTLVLD